MNMESESSRESKETQSHMIVAIEEIASNVIAFCRSVVSKSGIPVMEKHIVGIQIIVVQMKTCLLERTSSICRRM